MFIRKLFANDYLFYIFSILILTILFQCIGVGGGVVPLTSQPLQHSNTYTASASTSSIYLDEALVVKPNEEIVPLKIKRKDRTFNDNISFTKKRFNRQLPPCTPLVVPNSSLSSSSSSVSSSSLFASSFTGLCTDQWSDLKSVIRPTQKAVGYAWVQYKLLKDFVTKRMGQMALDSSITPAVIGPIRTTEEGEEEKNSIGNGNRKLAIYIIDDHHTFSALDMSNYDSIFVTINIICDLRNYTFDDFWSYMNHHNYTILAAYPNNQANALPTPINYRDMPHNITFRPQIKTLMDDPWRSLVGFSRKIKDLHPSVQAYISSKSTNNNNNGGNDNFSECPPTAKYCYRCFYRGCDSDGSHKFGPSVPFFEFRWSYYFLDAYLNPQQYWPTKSTFLQFKENYELLSSSSATVPLEKVYLQQWFTTASLLLPLCHHTTTGTYVLPEDIYDGNHTHLPGFTANFRIDDQDAECDQPSNCFK